MKPTERNIWLSLLFGGAVYGLYKLSSKVKTLKELDFKLKSFRIVKKPLPDYFKYGLPIEVEAYVINAYPEPLKFKQFSGQFSIADGQYNPLVFKPSNGIGIAPNGTSVLKFTVFIPIGSLSETIVKLASGAIPSYVNVKGKVYTNTLEIGVNEKIDLDLF